jgi:hypothetical protein
MGISIGHVQPQLLICYEFKGQSGPPYETKHPTITHSQRPILKPKIDPCPVNLTSKRASPFSSQIHRTRWLSLPAKVVVAEQTDFIHHLNCPKLLWLLKHKPNKYPHGEFSSYMKKLTFAGYEVEAYVQ